MTYKERYSQCNTIDELKQMAIKDTEIAILLGANPDRIRAIENGRKKSFKPFSQVWLEISRLTAK